MNQKLKVQLLLSVSILFFTSIRAQYSYQIITAPNGQIKNAIKLLESNGSATQYRLTFELNGNKVSLVGNPYDNEGNGVNGTEIKFKIKDDGITYDDVNLDQYYKLSLDTLKKLDHRNFILLTPYKAKYKDGCYYMHYKAYVEDTESKHKTDAVYVMNLDPTPPYSSKYEKKEKKKHHHHRRK